MAEIRAFKGIRPTKELAKKVAALPYDVMTSGEAREAAAGNPYSFLRIDRAEINFPKGTDEHDRKVYEKAAEALNEMIEKGVFIQDKKPVLYIYKQTMKGRSQTGIVACASVDEYIQNKIKKHELTLEKKELDRINHVDCCNANTGPIFLTYRDREAINREVLAYTIKNEPVYNFVSDDGVGHMVWVIDDDDVISRIIGEFRTVESLYIADGHHRCASAVKVGLKRRRQFPDADKNAEFNCFLSVIFPAGELEIMDYNRLVKDLGGLSVSEFLAKVEKNFEVCEYEGEGTYKPESLHTFGMYLGGKWYKLKAKNVPEGDPVKALDVSVLQDKLLAPILKIGDPRTDERIDFVGGIRGLKELERRVACGEWAVAFSMYPTSIGELMEVADAGLIMPPKSTWFEPKLRSGLFIHRLY